MSRPIEGDWGVDPTDEDRAFEKWWQELAKTIEKIFNIIPWNDLEVVKAIFVKLGCIAKEIKKMRAEDSDREITDTEVAEIIQKHGLQDKAKKIAQIIPWNDSEAVEDISMALSIAFGLVRQMLDEPPNVPIDEVYLKEGEEGEVYIIVTKKEIEPGFVAYKVDRFY